MNEMLEYEDLYAFHPGYYLMEILEEMHVSQAEFAIRMGTTPKTLSLLLNGQTGITRDLAKKLSLMLGTGSELWLNLQKTYDKKLIEIEEASVLDAQREAKSLLDYGYFEKFCSLPETRDEREQIRNLCRFLKVSDLRILLEPDYLTFYRGEEKEMAPGQMVSARAWVQTAVNWSEEIPLEPYSSKLLRSNLQHIRSLSVLSPRDFLAELKRLFSSCGVAFVLLPPLAASSVRGAVKWDGRGRVVLALSSSLTDVYDFWFSLFHEIKHVLQEKIRTVFVTPSSEGLIAAADTLEKEADCFASSCLIPPRDYLKLCSQKDWSSEELEAVASSLGIHPGIVLGRLVHDGFLKPEMGKGLEEYSFEGLLHPRKV